MALRENFYSEIFNKEKYWIELANDNLLNIYYINGKDGIRDFYINIKEELEKEKEQNGNQIIEGILNSINSIIEKIDFITFDYRKRKTIDINSIVELFLSNQMNNNIQKKEPKEEITQLKNTREMLKSMGYIYQTEKTDDEYLYDDFPEEENNIKKH